MRERVSFEREIGDLEIPFIGDVVDRVITGTRAPVPPGLRRASHFHVRLERDLLTSKWVPAVASSPLTPEALDTGFRVESSGLQGRLVEMLNRKYKDDTGRIWLALVDLTGDKIVNPEIGEWRAQQGVYGASVPKVLPLLAAFQLRFDLQELAREHGLRNREALLKKARAGWKAAKLAPAPQAARLLRFVETSASPVAVGFLPKTRSLIIDALVTRGGLNSRASQLIQLLGFPYIASVTWQSGLRDPLGGMWLARDFAGHDWKKNPVHKPRPVYGHTVSALSAAKFFTLLAQRRLVRPFDNDLMHRILIHGCTLRSGFDEGLRELGNLTSQAGKCGYVRSYKHEARLVERAGKRYVAVGLSKRPAFLFKNLIKDLDGLIQP